MASSLGDFDFPRKTIYKIIKSVLPINTKVSDEAKNALTRIAAIYVLFVSSTAQHTYQTNHLNAEIIIETVVNMGFDQFRQPLIQFLKEFKQKSEKKSKRQRNTGIKRVNKKNVEQKSIENIESLDNDMKPIQALNECKTEIKTEFKTEIKSELNDSY